VEGITLKSYLKENGPLPWEKAVDFATQIASALQHAHRKGIIHRDIKPQNILVTKDETLKVTDFGIARAVSSFTMKVDDNTMGTAHYCSPEQARGGYTDAKSDIYSLGVVMYEMVTGKLPFEGDSSVAVALKHIQEEAVPPTEIVPDLPVGVEEIIAKAMKKEQAERYSSISDLLIELSIVSRDSNYVPGRENNGETRVIPSGEVKKAIGDQIGTTPLPEKPGKKLKKPKTEKEKKEDKVAVIAALCTSFVFVAVISVLVISMMFPSILPWNRVTTELEAPNLIGYDIDKAVEDFPEFNIRKDGEEFSTEHEEGIILSQTPDKDTKLKSPFTIKVVISKGSQTVKVPSIQNLEYRQAIIKLEEENILYTLEYETSTEIPENVVIAVTPAPGTTIQTNKDIVTLKISSGTTQSYIVPGVIDKNVDEAKTMLTERGFSVSVVEKDSDKSRGTVIEQSIPGGSQLAERTGITITVSTGIPPAEDDEPTVSAPSGSDAPGNSGNSGNSGNNTGNSGNTGNTGTTSKPSTPDPEEETGSWF